MKSEEIKRLEFLETQVADQFSDLGKIFKRLEIIEKRLDVHIDRNREAQKVDELLKIRRDRKDLDELLQIDSREGDN